MNHRTTSTLSRIILAEVQAAEKLYDYKLDSADSLLLVEAIAHFMVRDIAKFVKGAKHHVQPLIQRVSILDIEDELTDGRFYTYAFQKRLNSTFNNTPL